MKIMTFNIRCDVGTTLPGEADYWPQRAPLVEKMLRTERPDILGVQELMDHQVATVQAGLGDRYAWAGKHRELIEWSGERNPVFYNRDVVELVRTKTFALSDTPDRLGSVTWDNKNPRILTCMDFQEKRSRKLFTVVNTHLDHVSEISRVKSADLIRRMFFWCQNVIVMGDFNDAIGSTTYKTLTRDYLDAFVSAKRRVSNWGTFNNYKDPITGGSRLDWILCSKEFEVDEIEVVDYNEHGDYPSDHLPVTAKVNLRG